MPLGFVTYTDLKWHAQLLRPERTSSDKAYIFPS